MPEVITMDQYRDAAQNLICLTGVLAADVVPDPGALDRPCIEVTVEGYERVPPRVYRTIAEHDLGVRPDLGGSQGRPRHWRVVVV